MHFALHHLEDLPQSYLLYKKPEPVVENKETVKQPVQQQQNPFQHNPFQTQAPQAAFNNNYQQQSYQPYNNPSQSIQPGQTLAPKKQQHQVNQRPYNQPMQSPQYHYSRPSLIEEEEEEDDEDMTDAQQVYQPLAQQYQQPRQQQPKQQDPGLSQDMIMEEINNLWGKASTAKKRKKVKTTTQQHNLK